MLQMAALIKSSGAALEESDTDQPEAPVSEAEQEIAVETENNEPSESAGSSEEDAGDIQD